MELSKTSNRSGNARRTNSIDLETTVFGKVPPQAKELEEAILGAVMIQKGAFDEVSSLLKPESFYVDAHQLIFRAMQSLNLKGQPLDILTVSEELRAREDLDLVGGNYYVTKLTNSVVSASNIVSHAKIVMQKFIQREVIRISGELIREAYEDACEPFELLEKADEEMTAITSSVTSSDMKPIDHFLVKALQQVENWRQRPDKSSVTGISTGNSHLDKLTRGWQNGDLIIVAARPSVGKTAFALNILTKAADQLSKSGSCVAMWSLEMSAVRLVLRMLAAKSEIWLMKIQTGNLSESDMKMLYQKGVQHLARLGIMLDDKPGLSIAKLKSKARQLKRKNNLGMIVIDYLQLMTPDEKKGGNREQEISKISRELKTLAQELEIPIIALSQLSREVEKRPDSEPRLSDLRESGAIEQDADMIMFLYGYSFADISHNADLENIRRIKLAKNREGMLDIFDVRFDGNIQLFTEISNLETGLPSNWRPVSTLPDARIEGGNKTGEEEPMPF